jgi:hypothetical protein
MRLGRALDAVLAGVFARLKRSNIPVDVTFTQGKSVLGLN